ncbi:hypothetical protein IJ472_06750 [bacterium]|nr:hypothetical protein [bacterium]
MPEGEVTTVTISTILDSVGDIFTAAIGWVGNVATTIVENPILLVFTVIPLVGLGVGLFRRLLSVN